MSIKDIFEVQTNDCGNPTFIIDYETEELVYLNQAMEKRFQIFHDYPGKHASTVIPFYEDIRGYHHKSDVAEGELLENTIYSEMLDANLRTKVTLWTVCGRKYLQTKFFLAPRNDKRQEAENLFEKAIAHCLEILSDFNLETPIPSFLALLGDFYRCEFAFVCEFDIENSSVSSHHSWSNSENPKDFPSENLIPMDMFIQWLQNDQHKSIINLDFSIHDFENYSIEEKILILYQIENMTLSKLWNKDGSLMGIVGLSNRANLMYDDRLLQAVSHFVMEQYNQDTIVSALEHFHEIDLLTGFYNRSKYTEKLVHLQQYPPQSLGVLFVNLNGLRKTNEYLGYEEGDLQLKKTSAILHEYFHGEFYRITGDEFVGFLENCDKNTFEETVNSLQIRLKKENQETAFSFGHSWESGVYSVENMIKIADTVMVINKQSYYSEALKNTDKITNAILQDIFRGIADDEFLVYLQPQVNLKTEEVVGAEALIRRLDRKTNKLIFPDSFIPIYEESATIRHVDLFVLRKTCQLINDWKHHGKEIKISVNLSRITLLEHGIVQTVSDILDEYNIDHGLIIIEVTERLGVTEGDITSHLVDEFKAKGFKLSLDDFGCAYSNIVTLAKISVDEVKIDKSLIDDVLTNEKNAVIVKNMLSMCEEFNETHMLAEGIETKEQAEFLSEAQCKLGQGYFYSRPIPSDEFFEKYIKQS
ncbi:MAG: GGDEF domain-containing phosphodiesterase [Eubacteriales bacterium]